MNRSRLTCEALDDRTLPSTLLAHTAYLTPPTTDAVQIATADTSGDASDQDDAIAARKSGSKSGNDYMKIVLTDILVSS